MRTGLAAFVLSARSSKNEQEEAGAMVAMVGTGIRNKEIYYLPIK
jgi:hypothetical protein